MIKKIFTSIFTIIFTALIPLMPIDSYAQKCGDVYSFVVFEDKNGDIVAEEKADEIIYPASLTKLMTVYLAFEAIKEGRLSIDNFITTSDKAEEISGLNRITTLKLQKGDAISTADAIEGAIIKSFNGATVMLAEAIAGSEWRFARLMNKKARQLGMYHSNFRNASGLHSDGHFTTSYDLAKLVIALKRDFPEYYHLFSLKKFAFNNIEFISHNKFLFDYQGAQGMKTGFTSRAGYNLVATAKRDKYDLTSILVSCSSSEDRNKFTQELLDNGFRKLANNKSQLQPNLQLVSSRK